METARAWWPASGELVAERFLLEDQIAQSKMASVWRAHHVALDCPCVVKFVIGGDEANRLVRRRRFRREARAAARLRSRHVVQILDFGVWRQTPFMAMELLEGETLHERLERKRVLNPEETLDLAHDVASALARAEAIQVVHRDLKPENIFIVSEGPDEYAKVLDFGIAKVDDKTGIDSKRDTQDGLLVGTPVYMSPEQIEGSAVDSRSDLWSLSVIMFECLTGEVPFYSDNIHKLTVQILRDPIPTPSAVHDGVSEAFDDWWFRAAARDPDMRFQTADAWYEALGDAIGDARSSSASWSLRPEGPTSGVNTGAKAFTSDPPISAKIRRPVVDREAVTQPPAEPQEPAVDREAVTDPPASPRLSEPPDSEPDLSPALAADESSDHAPKPKIEGGHTPWILAGAVVVILGLFWVVAGESETASEVVSSATPRPSVQPPERTIAAHPVAPRSAPADSRASAASAQPSARQEVPPASVAPSARAKPGASVTAQPQPSVAPSASAPPAPSAAPSASAPPDPPSDSPDPAPGMRVPQGI